VHKYFPQTEPRVDFQAVSHAAPKLALTVPKSLDFFLTPAAVIRTEIGIMISSSNLRISSEDCITDLPKTDKILYNFRQTRCHDSKNVDVSHTQVNFYDIGAQVGIAIQSAVFFLIQNNPEAN